MIRNRVQSVAKVCGVSRYWRSLTGSYRLLEERIAKSSCVQSRWLHGILSPAYEDLEHSHLRRRQTEKPMKSLLKIIGFTGLSVIAFVGCAAQPTKVERSRGFSFSLRDVAAASITTSARSARDPATVVASDPDLDSRVVSTREEGSDMSAWTIQTRVRELRSADRKRSIRVISTIHLAAPAYWTAIGRLIEGADSVAYEGLKRPETHSGEHPLPSSVAEADTQYMMRYRAAMATLTGWQMQSAWLSGARADSWVCADIDLRRFLALVDKQSPHDTSEYWEALLPKLEGLIKYGTYDGFKREEAKAPLQQIFVSEVKADIVNGNLALPESYRNAQLTRERRALDVIGELLSRDSMRTLAVFYGAEHTSRLSSAIVARFSFELQSEAWIDAASAPESAEDPIPVR